VNNIVSLSGYSVTEEIYTDSHTSIYRGSRNSDGYPVTIEIVRDRSSSFNRAIYLQNYYTIAKLFDLPNIIKPIGLETYRNSSALILEDFGRISLQDLLHQVGSFGSNSQTLIAFLKIAIQIAEALDGLYGHRVIHKDIKPENILIDPETQEIKLTNFRISSLLPREIQEIQGSNIIDFLRTINWTIAFWC
jgi:serine/threonine protein kinase